MAILPLDIYVMCQSLLNDQIGTMYPNNVLQPYLNIALRDLQGLMERANIPVTNATSEVIDLPAEGETIGDDVNDPLSPALPDGLSEIQGVYQRQNSNQDFTLITRLEFLTPLNDEPLSSYISAWAWQENIIRFIPANMDLQIKIDYIKEAIPTVGDDNTPIYLIGAMNYLGYRTASLAARYVGENQTRADVLDKEADVEWDQIEGVGTKGRQSISTRRRPFRSKSYSGWSGY